MKTIPEHIRHIRTKPHHVRKRVVFAAAGTGAGVIALVWLVGSLSVGAFAIKTTSFADANQSSAVVTTSAGTSDANGLAGAAAASQNANKPAYIEIVDVATGTPAKAAAQPTTIPF